MKKKPIDKNSKAYKRSKRRRWIFAIEVLVVLVLMVVGAYYVFIQRQLNNIQVQQLQSENLVINEEVETDPVIQGYTNIALFGLDTREGNLNQANSDAIIIASINNDTKEIRMVSVYRDSYLDVGGGSLGKANSAYAIGGPDQAVSMLNANLDLNITDYIAVDFDALAETIDGLGGLTITVTDEEAELVNGYCVETSAVTGRTYENLPGGGTYNLNGVQCVAYTRIRYTSGNDFKRTERQREVINLMIQKAKTAGIPTLYSIAEDVFPMILTSFSSTDLISLGIRLLSYDMGETTGFPFLHRTSQTGYNEVPVTLASNVTRLHEFLFDRTDYVPSAAVQERSNAIINATGYNDESLASSENYSTGGDSAQ